MTFLKKLVNRLDDLSGDSFILQEAPSGSSEYAQGVVLVDETGSPQGLIASPLIVRISAGTIVNFHSGASDITNLVVQATSGSLREVRVVLDPGAPSRHLMLFNATSLPSNGTAPVWQLFIPAGGEASEAFRHGFAYSTGMVAAISSTHETLTIVTSAEGIIFGQRI